MQADVVLAADEGRVRTLTINRPAQLNALNHAVLSRLHQEVGRLQEQTAFTSDRSDTVRAVMITGAGERAFVAGADIKELQSLTPAAAAEQSGRVQALFQQLRDLPVPVIAAVNGYALGGGLELALACDFIFAANTAVLGLVEADLGLIPGYAGVSRLVDRIGESRAREALYTSQKFSAADALAAGLVNRVTEPADLLLQCRETAEAIAGKGRHAIARLKQLVEATRLADVAQRRQLEQSAFGLTFADADAAEGIAAFVEKRPPQFEA